MSDTGLVYYCAGIYTIRYKPNGYTYVGQSNNILERWVEHKKQLNSGSHHNGSLQELWSQGEESDFEFEAVKHAPSGLSALELQRWLVKLEREIYLNIKEKGIELNIIEPEIVPTRKSVKEYRIESEESSKKHDKEISTERKIIKSKMKSLETYLNPKKVWLKELENVYDGKAKKLKGFSGWRKLIHRKPSGYSPDNEKKELKELSSKIDDLRSEVNKKENEYRELADEYKSLYKQFSKVAENIAVRAMWYGAGKILTKPKIME